MLQFEMLIERIVVLIMFRINELPNLLAIREAMSIQLLSSPQLPPDCPPMIKRRLLCVNRCDPG